MAQNIVLQPPQQFDAYADPNTGSNRWRKRGKQFRMFISASGITDKKRSLQMLLYTAGESIQEIVDNNIVTEGANCDSLIDLIQQYFDERCNVVFERYEFRKCIQAPGEAIDAWYNRLQSKSASCSYGEQTNSIIRDQIIACCNSERLRRRLLQTRNMSLHDALQVARTFESSESQAQAMTLSDSVEFKETANALQKRREPDWARTRREVFPQGAQHVTRKVKHDQEKIFNQHRSAVQTCLRCGRPGHRTCERARGKTCKSAAKQTTLQQRVCRLKQDCTK